MSITIEPAGVFAQQHGLEQVIIFGWDGKQTHITTWGDTAESSAQAATGANLIKQRWKWPAETIVESEKVTALKEELARLKQQLAELKSEEADGSVWVVKTRATYFVFRQASDADEWLQQYEKTKEMLIRAGERLKESFAAYEYLGRRAASAPFVSSLDGQPYVIITDLQELFS